MTRIIVVIVPEFIILGYPGPEHANPNKYGVLICGSKEPRHLENLSLSYLALLKNGYAPDKILVIAPDGVIINQNCESISATKKNIRTVFEILRDTKNIESLFIYTTGHGEREHRISIVKGKRSRTCVSALSLPCNSHINEKELTALIQNIQFGTGIFLFDQCYGGGFAKRLSGKNTISISASTPDESSQGNSFPQAFFGALLKGCRKKITVEKAFESALRNDTNFLSKAHKPQLFNPFSEEIFL